MTSEALSFLDYMRGHSRVIQTAPTSGLVVFTGDWSSYNTWVQELVTSGQIQIVKFTRRSVIMLGKWRAQSEWLAQVLTPEEEIAKLRSRYDESTNILITQAISSFASKRKCKEIKPIAVLGILKQWTRYPTVNVDEGLRIYLSLTEEQQFGEAYCLGIIRRHCKEKHNEVAPVPPPQPRSAVTPIPVVTRQQRIHEEFVRRGGESLSPQQASELIHAIERSLSQQ